MSIQITLKDGDKIDELTVNALHEAKRHGRALYVSISRLPQDTFVHIQIGDCPKTIYTEEMQKCGATDGAN